MKEQIVIRSPEEIFSVLKKWGKKRQENFLVVTLNGAHEVIKVHHITKGLVNRTIVHPREVFYPAIKDFAVAVALAHNHPSGNVQPSKEDDEITERLVSASNIIGIPVIDHIILTPQERYLSYRQEGKMR